MTVDESSATSLRRRSVLTGAVWSVPVVAAVTAAPAFAASPCAVSAQGTVDFASNGNYTRSAITPTLLGSALVPVSNQLPVTVTFTYAPSVSYAVNAGNMAAPGAFSPSVGLTVYQQRTGTETPYPTLTIGFSRPVTNVVVPFKDITWPAANPTYRDSVVTVPSPTSSVLGANVTGTGVVGTPYRRSTQGAVNFPPTADVTATATFAGPLNAIVVSYYDTSTTATHAPQAIQIGNFTFDTKPAGCIVV